jgi:hypothetical protein
MNFTCRLGGLALIMLGLTACEPSRQTGPLSTMPTGTNESLLRQQQLRSAQQDGNASAFGAPGVPRTC